MNAPAPTPDEKRLVLIQDIMLRQLAPEALDPIRAQGDLDVSVFTMEDRRSTGALDAAEASLTAAGDAAPTPIVFCSLQVSALLRSGRYPRLARGVFHNPDTMRFHRYSAQVPDWLLVNHHHILTTLARLEAGCALAADAFGADRLFIRPDSGAKPFTGFDAALEDIAGEARFLRGRGVDASELCVVAPARTLSAIEHRFWVIEGEIATHAAYGWDPRDRNQPLSEEDLAAADRTPPPAMRTAVLAIAERLLCLEPLIVLDMTMLDGEPRLVEANALSTSGFYDAVDLGSLIRGVKRLL